MRYPIVNTAILVGDRDTARMCETDAGTRRNDGDLGRRLAVQVWLSPGRRAIVPGSLMGMAWRMHDEVARP